MQDRCRSRNNALGTFVMHIPKARMLFPDAVSTFAEGSLGTIFRSTAALSDSAISDGAWYFSKSILQGAVFKTVGTIRQEALSVHQRPQAILPAVNDMLPRCKAAAVSWHTGDPVQPMSKQRAQDKGSQAEQRACLEVSRRGFLTSGPLARLCTMMSISPMSFFTFLATSSTANPLSAAAAYRLLFRTCNSAIQLVTVIGLRSAFQSFPQAKASHIV